jgi:hypothetical protein
MRKYLPIAILLLLPIVHAGVSTSPSSLTFNLGIGENAVQTITLIVDNASYSDVQVFVVGNSPTSDEVLRACVTVYPSYVVSIENENRQFSVSVKAVGVNPGTYTGLVRFTQVGKSVPITVNVAGVVAGGYIEADKGSIKATLPSYKSVKKAVIFYNRTGRALANFTAEMEDTQIYDDIDWVQVEYEAPQFVQSDGYVTVSLTIDTTGVPTGRYQRRLKAWAWADNTKYQSEVMLDITIYGGSSSSENVSTLDLSAPSEATVGSQVTIRVTSGGNPVSGVDILLDGSKVGTTNSSGLGSMTISTKGSHTLSVKYRDKEATKTLTVYSSAYLQISAPRRVSDEISGTVTSDGVGVPGVRVMLGSVSALTDSGGNFRLSLGNIADGTYTLTASKRDEQEYTVYSGSLSVEVKRLHIPYTWIVSVVATVGVILVSWKRGLFEKLTGGGKVEKV